MTTQSALRLNRFLLPLLTLGALTLLPALASGQPLAVDENYRLHAGDVVVIQVLGQEKLGGSLPVGPAGSIALPLVGSVPVAGKTLREVQEIVTRHYEELVRRPYVSAALDETASRRRVYVSGAVEKPGSQMLPFGATLPDAVVAAGFTEQADLAHVTLQRTNEQTVVADLSGLRTNEPLQTGVVLQWDDRVTVPERANQVSVVGQVAKPGPYRVPLGRSLTVLELITQLAGGLTPAAGPRALLIRPGADQPTDIDLARLLEQGDMTQNLELQIGDTLVVSETTRVTIAGEVNAPTSFVPDRNLTLLEGIIRAGGITPNAGLREVQLRRGDETTVINFEDVWRRGDASGNLALQPGDVVIVPKAGPQQVLITGAVAKAGTIDIRDQERPTLLELLASAGKTDHADYSRVSIYREGQHVVANAQRALEAGDMQHNPELLSGDVVYVPEVGKVALLGAFAKPGLVDYDPKLSFLQYLALGGVPAPGAARLDRGVVIRTCPDGTYQTTMFDVSRITAGVIPEPIEVQPGDVIYLQPRQPKRDLWTQLRDLLFMAGGLRWIFE